MLRQTLVIGLGQFGRSLARALSSSGTEVLAVDADEGNVSEVQAHVSDAVVMDATDEAALASLAPGQRDTCVCAIGGHNREGSIIVTALLKQLGARHIIARATDDLHARILSLVGADEVVNPERNYGERLAIRLSWPNVLNIMELGGNLVFVEMRAPQQFWGRTLTELELAERFSVTVSAVLHESDAGVVGAMPDPRRPLRRGDILMYVSTAADARKLAEQI